MSRSWRVAGVLGCLVLAGLCLRLGVWQLERAGQSRTVAALVEQRSEMAPLEIDAGLVPDDTLPFRQASVEGWFEFGDHLLLDHRRQDGRSGYHLIVPLRIAGSETRVLVNRGWVAPDQVPNALPPASHRIEAVIARPSVPPLRLAGEGSPVWEQRVWPFLDLEIFEARRGYPVLPFVLIAEPRLAAETRAAGLARADKWGMHMGYAAQWFVFAVLALLLAGLMVRSRGERH